MYSTLLIFHNTFRWVAQGFLLCSIYLAFNGYFTNSPFSKTDNSIRHWTATVLQVQMTLGFILYFNSPFVQAGDSFFKVIHLSMMFTAVVILSVGSALAKRKSTDREKFKTMLLWFSIALFIILIAIPWPFSPFSQRPYFRFQ